MSSRAVSVALTKVKAVRPDPMPGYTLPVYDYRAPREIARKASVLYAVIVVGGGLTAALELWTRGVRAVVLDDDNTVGALGPVLARHLPTFKEV